MLISGNPAPDIKDGESYPPQSENFPAFDSWASGDVFQLTIAETHDSGKTTDLTKAQACKVVDALSRKHDSKANSIVVIPQFGLDSDWKTMQAGKQPEMADKIEYGVVCFAQNPSE